MKALYNGCTFEFDLEGATYTDHEFNVAVRDAARRLVEDQHAELTDLRAEVERLREENAELQVERRQWRDASREQPKDGLPVFCADIHKREVFTGSYNCGVWWDIVNACASTVTHWQPMPGLVGIPQPLPAPPDAG